MKELSIEEKAKAYDVAIERARTQCSLLSDRATMEYIFPELRESEDEKIRKAIIDFFKQQDDNTTYSFVPKKDIIDWLEKQGEQKPVDKVEPKFKVGDTIHYKEENTIFPMVIDRISGGYYECDGGKCCVNIKFQDYYELVKQTSTWSEEDEDYYDAIIAKLEVTQDDASLTDNQMEFLKSLKYRVQLHPKQEWSEKDDYMLNNIRDFVAENLIDKNKCACADECLKWLKSFKERVQLQPKQEWSEEDKGNLLEVKCIIGQLPTS